MKKSIRLPFNMVEIALALAVVGIGIAGVMALFPVGFNSIRDAMAESYGADITEEFMSQISRTCKADWTTWVWTGNYDTGSSAGKIPTSKSYTGDTGNTSDIDKDDPGGNASIDWCHDNEAINGNIYFDEDSADDGGLPDDFKVFKIVRKTGNIVDFEAAVRVWMKPIENLNVAGQDVDFNDIGPAGGTYYYGMVLYAEISWPYSKPYSKREKRTYCKEIFRPM